MPEPPTSARPTGTCGSRRFPEPVRRKPMHLVDQDVPGPKRDYPGYGRRQPKVVWPDDAKLVVSICVNHEEGSEYSQPAGDNRNEGLAEIPYVMPPEYRDLAAESVYEYGSRAGVFRLHAPVRRVQDRHDLVRRRGRDRAQPRGRPVDPGDRPSRCAATAGAGASTGSCRARRRRRRSAGRSPPSRRRAASGRSAGTAATARASTRASCSSRRAASSTTPTPTTTTCRTSPR